MDKMKQLFKKKNLTRSLYEFLHEIKDGWRLIPLPGLPLAREIFQIIYLKVATQISQKLSLGRSGILIKASE